MGTSHRHIATIIGQPNWGDVSSAVTSIAKDIDKSKELEDNPPLNLSPSQIKKKQSTYGIRIIRNYHKAVKYLVRAAGGRNNVSSGKSKAIGHAGISVANSLAYAITSAYNEIINNGFDFWLKKKGIDSLNGKTCRDILDTLKEYIELKVVGLDSTSANQALEHVLDILETRMGKNPSNFEIVMNETMTPDGIKDLLDEFFGMYVFSHLSQNFEEKIEYERGSEVQKATMEEIKDLIIDDIKRAKSGRSSAKIDWASQDGAEYIQKEFDRILYILSGNED